jgi:hypothetical protein
MYCMPPICSFLCTLYYPRTYFCFYIAYLLWSGHVLSRGNTFGAADASIGITRYIYVMILMSYVTCQILDFTLILCTRPTHIAPPPMNVVLLCYPMVVVVCSSQFGVRIVCFDPTRSLYFAILQIVSSAQVAHLRPYMPCMRHHMWTQVRKHDVECSPDDAVCMRVQ